jgi:hypothetical protein
VYDRQKLWYKEVTSVGGEIVENSIRLMPDHQRVRERPLLSEGSRRSVSGCRRQCGCNGVDRRFGTQAERAAGQNRRRCEGEMMRVRTILACVLALGVGVAVDPPHAAGEEAAKSPVVGDLSGRWIYDTKLSDDAREKMREAMERQGPPDGGPMGPGMGGPPGPLPDGDPREAMQPIFEPSEELTITQSEQNVVIDEMYGRSRTLHPNGKKYKADNGTSEVKSEWKDGRLIVETKHDRGRKTVETWERSVTGRRLTATYKITGGFGPSLTLRRVYERAPASVPSEPR